MSAIKIEQQRLSAEVDESIARVFHCEATMLRAMALALEADAAEYEEKAARGCDLAPEVVGSVAVRARATRHAADNAITALCELVEPLSRCSGREPWPAPSMSEVKRAQRLMKDPMKVARAMIPGGISVMKAFKNDLLQPIQLAALRAARGDYSE